MGKRTNTAVWSDKYKRWQVNVQQDGKRRSFYSSTPGRTGQREANAKADAWLDNGIENTGTKVAALYEDFITAKKAGTSQSHWRGVVSRWQNHICPVIGLKRIDRLSENHLQEVINRAYTEKHLSAKSLQNLRSDLVAFMKFCRRAKATTMMPEGLTIPASAARPQKRIVQPRDLIKLFNCDTTIYRGKRIVEPYIHAYRFEVLSGFRPGEIKGLEWADIVGMEVHLSRAINVYGEVTQGKNANAVRLYTMSALAAAEIEAQRKLTGGEKYVFDISTEQTYRKHWLRYLAANGMAHTTPYELRHTFVSIAKKLPEGLVKSLVGHSQSMDTFGVYGHAVEGEAADTAQRVNDLFSDILQKPTT